MFNQPMFNPQIMQLLNIARSNGNPMMWMQNMFGDNPVFQKVMAMGQGKNPTQLQEVVRNIAHEQGMSDEQLNAFISNFGLKI